MKKKKRRSSSELMYFKMQLVHELEPKKIDIWLQRVEKT